MIEIKVNDEIRDVTADVGKGLSIGQWLWIISGLFFGTFVGFTIYRLTDLPLAIISYILILFVVPFGAMAFYKWHEMSPLAAISLAIKRLSEPKIKLYECENEEYIAYLQSLTQKERKEKKGKENE